jgi:hypothetical protein
MSRSSLIERWNFNFNRIQEKRKLQLPLLRNATVRGRVYFEWAERYLQPGDLRNACSTAEESIRLACGPFYVSVRDNCRTC